MDESLLFELMVDLHRDGWRQGPGSDDETLRGLELTRLDRDAELQVADIGCGTGASTLVLANHLPHARIVAIDLFPEFLEILSERARKAGCDRRIETLEASMDALNLAHESLDLIWSEGAIYNIGFQRGVENWRRFLRPGGVLAVSEITWLRPDPPEEIRRHWEAEYSEIATAPNKIRILEDAGYDLLGYFTLPPDCWIAAYYEPTAKRIPDFLNRHHGQPAAAELAEMESQEADLYRRYRDWFSYGFYIARRR